MKRVSPSFARPVDACRAKGSCVCDSQSAFTLCDQGSLRISDRMGANGNAGGNVGQNLPAVVVSHGANRQARTQSREEMDNYGSAPLHPRSGRPVLDAYAGDVPEHFVWHEPRYQQGQVVFDDLLIWLSPYVLKTRLIQAGRLP